MTEANEWAGWQALLAGKPVNTDPNEPFAGFYRTRRFKDGPFVPVAYWRENGKLMCVIDGTVQSEERAIDQWIYCVRNPVSHEAYIAVTERGEPWPDLDPTLAGFRLFRDTGYRVSENGRVMSPQGRILVGRPNGQGYLRVQLGDGNDEYIHRMVAVAFHGEPPTPEHEVDHINSVRDDNAASNIRWVTKAENLAQREIPRGVDHANAKVTEAHVRIIRQGPFYRGRDSDLAESMGISREQVRDIRNGKAWAHVSLEPPSSLGDNEPPDEAEILKDQIESAAAGASAYAKIEDDETLAKAQSLRARLNELSRTADKSREAMKKPHLEAGKAIDAKWQPLVKMAKETADAIAKAMGAWETVKAKRAREEQAKRDAEIRRQQEEARKAEEAGKPAPEPVLIPEPEPVATAPIKGAYGRAASVKVVKVATVVDQDKVYAFMRERPEVRELLAKLAQRATDAGHDVPGVEIEEQRKVA